MNSPEIPPNQDKLKQGPADEDVPVTSRRKSCAAIGHGAIPVSCTSAHLCHTTYRAPDVISTGEDQDEQNQFNENGIPELHRRVNDHLEPREHRLGDDVTINELSHDQAHSPVHQNLGNNKEWQ